ncbi:hypothetical protein pb186bvf_005284 [Paramecium bursaria]
MRQQFLFFFKDLYQMNSIQYPKPMYRLQANPRQETMSQSSTCSVESDFIDRPSNPMAKNFEHNIEFDLEEFMNQLD